MKAARRSYFCFPRGSNPFIYCSTHLVVVGYIKHFFSSQETFGTGLSETRGDQAMVIMDIFTLKWAITCVVSTEFFI